MVGTEVEIGIRIVAGVNSDIVAFGMLKDVGSEKQEEHFDNQEHFCSIQKEDFPNLKENSACVEGYFVKIWQTLSFEMNFVDFLLQK